MSYFNLLNSIHIYTQVHNTYCFFFFFIKCEFIHFELIHKNKKTNPQQRQPKLAKNNSQKPNPPLFLNRFEEQVYFRTHLQNSHIFIDEPV